jgi:hypothetical protein
VQQAGLGYILRCRDYHLLKEPGIAQRIERAAVWEWQEIGGNSFSEIMDLGYVEALGRGYATPMRVIALRTPEKLPQSKGVGGRRVTVMRRASSRAKGVVATRSAIVRSAFRWLMNPQLQYEQPLYWCDIAASELWRSWHEHLSRQEVEIKWIGRQRQAAAAPLLSRAQREHRRLSWSERWERNERAAAAAGWVVVLYSGKAIAAGMRDLSHRSFS